VGRESIREIPAKGECIAFGTQNIDVYSVVPENIDTPPMNVFSCLNNLPF